MNYQKIYDQIIDRAKNRKLEGYKEKHHIIPKCIGGNNKKENIVELTSREHFLCHWLLFRINSTHRGISYSFWIMSNRYIKNRQSSRAYQEAREIFSKLNKGKKLTDKHRKIISKTNKGNKNLLGYKYTEKQKENQSKSHLGKKREKWVCDILSKSMLGKKKSKQHAKNISKAKMGKGNHMFGIKGKNNPRSKPILQFDIQNNFIKEWGNCREASENLNINPVGINNCCHNKTKTSGGYKWKFK